MKHRLLRSVLYLPASNLKMVEKAVTSLRTCDAFIFDCEDAVSKDAKEHARTGLRQAISSMKDDPYSRTVVARVNGIRTQWFEKDCEAAVGADAVLLPKAENLKDLETLRSLIGVLNARELSQLSSVFVLGLVDLANELGCSTDPKLERQNLLFPIQSTLLAARAAGIQIVDGVYIHLSDDTGFRKECEQGFQLGFDGKSLIHPKTIELANQIFSPSESSINDSLKIVKAYENSNKGAIQMDGRLVEELHVRKALRTIEFSKIIQKRKQ